MNKRSAISFGVIGGLLLLSMFVNVSCNTALSKKTLPDRPNILFLLTDDQTFSTIRALGNREIITPTMDRLVAEGTTFTQAHIMGGLGGAICMPSRAMILTGRTLFHLHEDGTYIPTTDSTFPQVFRANGYVTFGTGKWHQDKRSFNCSFTTGDNIFFGGMNAPRNGGQYRPRLYHFDSSGRYGHPFWGEHFSSIYFADAAIDFLKQRRDSQQPFLMYVSFTSPHDPRTPPSWYGHSYHTEDVSLPASYLPEHPFDNGELRTRDEMLLPIPRTEEGVRREIAKYYGMISEVDHQIGRIIDALKKNGKAAHTVIVFTSDNGLAVGQHGLLGKQNPYDCTMRVPLVFAGPGIPEGKRTGAYVYLNDLYPTLCQLAGIPVPATVEGQSLIQAFEGNVPFQGRDQVFFAHSNLQRAIVKDSFKLIRYNVNGQYPVQLFNLEKDPLEMHNLADEKQFQGKAAKLNALLDKTMKELGDFCDPGQQGWGYPEKLYWDSLKKIYP